MISDVFRQFIDSHKTGLGIIELPTSIGKTYSTFECIAKYTEEWAEYAKNHEKRGSFRQILFVTSRKNNLQNGRRKSVDGKEDELHGLREAYANRGRKDKYEDEVLFLNALPEILKDNLKTLTSDRVIQPYLCKLPEYDKLTSKVVKMATSTVLQDDEELYKEVSKEAVKLYFEFRKHILPAYRRETNESRKMTLADLGEMDGYGWLFKLYPDLLIPKRKVLLMSFNKLLDGRVYEKPACAFRSSQFLKNKIVIIDEFDSTKQTVKDSLAAEQSEHQVDFLQLFHNIYSGAKTIWASPSFEEIDHKLEDINYNLEKVMERADKRRSDYKLDYNYKTAGELRDNNQAFIFMDNATRTITKTGGGMQIIARPSDGSVILLLCRQEDKQPGDFYLDGTIRWVTGFLKHFANYVQRLASNYEEQRNKATQDTTEAMMSFEDAYRSYLYKYGISRNEMTPNYPTRLLMDMADASNVTSSRRDSGLRQGYDYYFDGFTYYSMSDAPHHDDNTIVNMVDIPITAESLLVKMSKSALVMGMSATAGIPSATGNYNLNWCQDNIEDYFDVVEEYPELAKEVNDFLYKRYEPYREGRITINTHVIPNGKELQNQSNILGDGKTEPCKILKGWGIPDKEAIRIELYVRKSLLQVSAKEYNYCVLRYYNLLKVMLDFAGRKHMQSLIYLGSKAADGDEQENIPTGRNKFDKWMIRKLVCAVNHLQGNDGAAGKGLEIDAGLLSLEGGDHLPLIQLLHGDGHVGELGDGDAVLLHLIQKAGAGLEHGYGGAGMGRQELYVIGKIADGLQGRHFDDAVLQHLAQIRRTGFQVLDLGLGILLGKGQQQVRDLPAGEGGRDAEAQHALLTRKAAGDLVLGRLLDLAHALGLLIEDHAGVGELQPAGAAEEEAGAVLLFHGLDLIAESRLGDMKLPGGGCQTSFFDDGDVVEIVLKIHSPFLRIADGNSI